MNTSRFHLYAFGEAGSPIKVGYSGNLRARLATIRYQEPGATFCSDNAAVLHTIGFADAEAAGAAERGVHHVLRATRLRRIDSHYETRGLSEWFAADPEQVIDAMNQMASAHGGHPEPPLTLSTPKRSDLRERVHLTPPASWVDRLDEWRRTQRPIPNRSEAIRALVDHALAADIKAPERKGGRK